MRVRTFKECDATIGENAYITIGEWYEISWDETILRDGNFGFEFIDDKNRNNYACRFNSSHLDYENWEIEA